MNGRSDKNPMSDDGCDLFPEEAPDFAYPSEEELIRDIFPSPIEAFAVFERLIAEWEEKRLEARHDLQVPLDCIAHEDDPSTRYLLKETLKITGPAERMREAIGQIKRLKRLRGIAQRVFGVEVPTKPGELTPEQIERARAVPILDVISRVVQLNKRGKSYIGLCPFHKDTNPSFNVYPQQNRFYCFGCQKGGDAIDFVRLHYGYGFKKAINYLLGGCNDE